MTFTARAASGKKQYFHSSYQGQRILISLDSAQDEYVISGAGALSLCMECLERDMVTNSNWLDKVNGTGYFTIGRREFEERFPDVARAKTTFLSVV